jgi:Fe-S cluster assembly protein SufD
MSATQPALATPSRDLSELERGVIAAPPPGPIAHLQREAMDRFQSLGLPARRDEAWRFTSLKKAVDTPYAPADGPGPGVQLPSLASLEMEAHRLVLVDGYVVPELSSLDTLPDGVEITGLAEALDRHPSLLRAHLGQHAAWADRPFVALSTASLRDAAVVRLARRAVVDTPVHIVSLATRRDAPTASFPRVLILAEEQSQASVIETYVGGGDDTLIVPVTEVIAGRNAVVHHMVDQRHELGTTHIGALHVHLERDATVHCTSSAFGSDLARREITAVLAGEGADCRLDGLYAVAGKQHTDTQVVVEHRSPHCTSEQLFKGVLDDSGRSVFNGRILVAEGAQKTSALQSNRNLLLSRSAQAHSNPQLEIFADDVRCTHGSTTGRLDADAVFYMRSRGLDRGAAEALLTVAFADEVLSRIPVDEVHRDARRSLATRLPLGDSLLDEGDIMEATA